MNVTPGEGASAIPGAVVYKKHSPTQLPRDRKIWLDLGTVKYIPTGSINGKDLGLVWTSPWRIDISSAVIAGDNEVEIAVANVRANRPIGDEREPSDATWQMSALAVKGGYLMKVFPQ